MVSISSSNSVKLFLWKLLLGTLSMMLYIRENQTDERLSAPIHFFQCMIKSKQYIPVFMRNELAPKHANMFTVTMLLCSSHISIPTELAPKLTRNPNPQDTFLSGSGQSVTRPSRGPTEVSDKALRSQQIVCRNDRQAGWQPEEAALQNLWVIAWLTLIAAPLHQHHFSSSSVVSTISLSDSTCK